VARKVPVGKGAKDLAQPSFMTSRSSEITTDPSAARPQYNFTPPSEPCKTMTNNFVSRSTSISKKSVAKVKTKMAD